MSRLIKNITVVFILCISVADSAHSSERQAYEPDFPGAGLVYDPQQDLILANRLYSESNFREAALVYQRIINAGYHAAGVYYNLGNAYYRSGNIPSAILNYERAALLSPGDEDIMFNLELARTRVRDRIETLPQFFLNRWWQRARNLVSTGTWAILSVSFFIMMLAVVSVFLFSSSMLVKKASFWLAVSFLTISLLSFSLGMDQRNYLRNHAAAIVFAPVVPVKSSPDAYSADLFLIHEGTKVRVEESIGDWRLVRLNDGNKGWIRVEDIEMI
jgi:tetratricopeptide (TPR) repeat protein